MDIDVAQRLVAATLAAKAVSVVAPMHGDTAYQHYVKVYREMLKEVRSVEKDEATARAVNDFVNKSR